jgi:hypothetical protein
MNQQQKRPFPNVSKPKFIGEFGNKYEVDNVEVYPGRSKMRYLLEPLPSNVDFDLNAGFEQFQEKPMFEEKIDGLLKYLMKVSEPGSNLRKVSIDILLLNDLFLDNA